MGNRLDTVLIEELVSTPITINTDYNTDSVDLTFREAEFSIQVVYDSGVNVDMTLFLEVSLDNVNFSRITDSEQIITDPSGSHVWSVGGEGASYLRVGIEVTTGSIDVDYIYVHMKRRH